jgi:hypothetical protein
MDMGRFKFWSGDVNYVDYGGTWCWRAGPLEFHFIELMNWEDQVGTREAEEVGYTYNVTLKIVHLDELSDQQVVSAIRGMGCEEVLQELETKKDTVGKLRLIAGCAAAYGTFCRGFDENGNNYRELIAEAKRASLSWAGDDSILDRPVNRIGQTGRELMKGDLASALHRGMTAGDMEASIMAQMYRASGGATIGGYIGDEVMEVVNRHE